MRNKKRMYCPYPIKNNQRKQNNKSRDFLRILLAFAIIILIIDVVVMMKHKPSQLMWGRIFFIFRVYKYTISYNSSRSYFFIK